MTIGKGSVSGRGVEAEGDDGNDDGNDDDGEGRFIMRSTLIFLVIVYDTYIQYRTIISNFPP